MEVREWFGEMAERYRLVKDFKMPLLLVLLQPS